MSPFRMAAAAGLLLLAVPARDAAAQGSFQPPARRAPSTFERRAAGGPGLYLTRADIERRHPVRLVDLLGGIVIGCDRLPCQLRPDGGLRSCPAAVFVDDIPADPSAVDAIPPSNVFGIEIYRGVAELPPELGREPARCGGAIVIWTRSGDDPAVSRTTQHPRTR